MRRRRIATVALAPAAALIAWALLKALGIDLDVGAGDVIAAALAGALGGWLVAALVDRHARRPQVAWIWIATTVLSVSMIGPSRVADGLPAVALMALHFVVAIVVITGFVRTLDA